MSGSFEKLDVPPTLVSFAVTTAKTADIISPEFKEAGNRVVLFTPKYDDNGLPVTSSLIRTFTRVNKLIRSGTIVSCYTVTYGGAAEAVMKMCFGNGLGFAYREKVTLDTLFGYRYGAFVAEVSGNTVPEGTVELGRITADGLITRGKEVLTTADLFRIYEGQLEGVFRCNIPTPSMPMENFSYTAVTRPAPAVKVARPRVLIPVFPGTNCEYDSAKAVRDAGADAQIVVMAITARPGRVAESVEDFAAQSATSADRLYPRRLFGRRRTGRKRQIHHGILPQRRSQRTGVRAARAARRFDVRHLQRLPGAHQAGTGSLRAASRMPTLSSPTLTYNTIARHQSKHRAHAHRLQPFAVAVRHTGRRDLFSVPISHGEGRFIADEALIRQLAANGQIATQYADEDGHATADIRYNPNGSLFAVEGITSPDGRVFGKMGHSERYAPDLYRNVPGCYDIRMFESAVRYFR